MTSRILASFCVAVSLAAIILSAIAITDKSPVDSSTLGGSLSGVPASGLFQNGKTDEPHYFVSLSSDGSGNVDGSMNFIYQDGRIATVFTFRGTAEPFYPGSSLGFAEVRADIVSKSEGTSLLTSSVPGVISFTYSKDKLSFNWCNLYLSGVANQGDCAFKESTSAVI